MSDRLNAEWLTVSAVRELAALATHSEPGNISYNDAIRIAKEIAPMLLGEESLLGKGRAPYLAQEFEERARLKTLKRGEPVLALTLVEKEIRSDRKLLKQSERSSDSEKVNRIKARLSKLEEARDHLDPRRNSEHELIFRDGYLADREFPSIYKGKSHNDFHLEDDRILRIRVLHPDKAEHILGADLIYERHNAEAREASIAAVQYKIWEDRSMYLNDPRMQKQIEKMKEVFCNKDICKAKPDGFRFPCCSAFLRPTDKLQSANQALRSAGEHLPICMINDVATTGKKGGKKLEWSAMREVSLSAGVFEELFVAGRIGSNPIPTDRLEEIYSAAIPDSPKDRVIIYAQEIHNIEEPDPEA